MQQRILKRTGLLQLKHAIVINHSDLWSRFDCDQIFINHDYRIMHLQDDMKLRYFYETGFFDRPDEKHIIVIEENAFRIPYDIAHAIPVINLSYEILFPMLDASALEAMPGLDYDHLSFVADRAAVRSRDRQETISFCTTIMNSPGWSSDYAEKLLDCCHSAVRAGRPDMGRNSSASRIIPVPD